MKSARIDTRPAEFYERFACAMIFSFHYDYFLDLEDLVAIIIIKVMRI